MSYSLSIVDAQQIETTNKYILTTSEGTKYVWYHPQYNPDEDKKWLERVKEGDEILLDWIKNKEGISPASIGWNTYGYALLHIKLRNIYNVIPEYNISGGEINSLETHDVKKWVIDKNCPFIDDVDLKMGTKVRLQFNNGLLVKSYIESDIFEKLEEHIDAETAVWELNGSSISTDRKTHTYWIKLLHNTKNYYITKLTKDEMIVI
jgi:hypothetical protein